MTRSKEHILTRLKLISQKILNPDATIGELHSILKEYSQCLSQLIAFDISDLGLKQDLTLEKGVALNPIMAALCLDDIVRTHQFINGLDEAIQAAQNKFNSKHIHIIYAGTGPFASLALPIIMKYHSNEVQFTMIEANPNTFDFLQKIIQKLGIEDYIKELILGDATQCELEKEYHVLLSETMQYALVKEPQVSIFFHLSQFLVPDAFIIPESIHVEAALLNTIKRNEKMLDLQSEITEEEIIRPLQTVLNLNKELSDSSQGKEIVFPNVDIELPNDALTHFNQLVLTTTIHVFGDHYILPWQSGLTIPYKIREWNIIKQQFSIQYKISDQPYYKIV